MPYSEVINRGHPEATTGWQFFLVVFQKVEIMKEKKCSKCGENKLISEFHKDVHKKDLLCSHCKQCDKEYVSAYSKTKDGLISRIYATQRMNSKIRNHPMPVYLKQELRKWLLSQPLFHELFDNWKASGYKKVLSPSCDRTDNYKGYSLDRLRVCTWNENYLKACSDRKHGINNECNKAVVGIHKITEKRVEFHSQMEAERMTGIQHSNISKCCLNKPNFNSAGGYTWIYK